MDIVFKMHRKALCGRVAVVNTKRNMVGNSRAAGLTADKSSRPSESYLLCLVCRSLVELEHFLILFFAPTVGN